MTILHKFRTTAIFFIVLLLSLSSPALSQNTSETAGISSAVRVPDAMKVLRKSFAALGGSEHWSAHSSLQAVGTVNLLKKDYQVVWSDDWSGTSMKSTKKLTTDAGTRTFTADASHGSWMEANGQKTRSKDAKLSDSIPMHLPAVLLAKALSDTHLTVRESVNNGKSFPHDKRVEVSFGKNPFATQEWLINPESGMPDELIVRRTDHNHPNQPIPVTITYAKFGVIDGRSVATEYSVDIGQLHEAVSLTSLSFDAPVPTNP